MKRRILGAITIASTLIPITSVSCSFFGSESKWEKRKEEIKKAVEEYSKENSKPSFHHYSFGTHTCKDGWTSFSSGRGTCSHHGGISHNREDHLTFSQRWQLSSWYSSLLKHVNKKLKEKDMMECDLEYLKKTY